jgi:ABC-type lipopolysaccharide export system ATPase subunit
VGVWPTVAAIDAYAMMSPRYRRPPKSAPLNEAGITIVLIEHIMRAVMSFSTRLVVLVAGHKIADGAPQEAIRNPEVERAYLGE